MEHALSFRRSAYSVSAMGVVLPVISIFVYIGSLVGEAMARGVIGRLRKKRKRRGAIEVLRDDYIICGTEEELRALEGLFAPRETLAC